MLTIIGDAVARPLIDEYAPTPDRYDASSLFSFGPGGAPLSPRLQGAARRTPSRT